VAGVEGISISLASVVGKQIAVSPTLPGSLIKGEEDAGKKQAEDFLHLLQMYKWGFSVSSLSLLSRDKMILHSATYRQIQEAEGLLCHRGSHRALVQIIVLVTVLLYPFTGSPSLMMPYNSCL
jgi:hypothetical protein